METRVSSPTKEVIIGDAQSTVLIGERINPAGKTKLQEALKAGNLDIVRREALAQAQAGADILDVNVGTFGVDEVTLLPQAVQAVMDAVDIPLCLDSNNPAALEAALKIYKGKPLINSVTGEEHSLAKVLPLVKEYGAAVVGLVQDDEGIPKDAERRISVARKLVERAEAAGIAREDIIIDCLAFAVGADTSSGPAIIEAIRRIRAELGVNITLGASNVSFGLPDRELLNNAFVVMAVAAGATCLIVDVAKVRPAIVAADLLLGRDRHARRYIEAYRQRQK
ncbi:MAG: dihydropteroate synthase [Chloroflexi bacterium]|nr:dihydropteroate synthase [Chloroflexota bacterium]